MSGTAPSENYCISCHEVVSESVETHWQTSDACSPLGLSPQQVSVARGLLFTTGTLDQDGEMARLTFYNQDESLVNWVASTFGVLTKSVSREGDDWCWQSHLTPGFLQFAEYWLDAEGRPTVPETVDITPEVLRTVYAVCGDLRDTNGTPRPVFATDRTTANSEELEQLMRHFHPLQFETLSGATEVYLNQTDDFFQYIGPPIPGRINAWFDDHRRMLDGQERCSHCLREYQYIEAHWRASSTCTTPMLSWRQHELVEGVLLGGGRLEPADDGYRLTVSHTARPLLDALDEVFGELSAGVRETETGRVWHSRASSELMRFSGWLDEDGSIHVPNDIHHTSEMLRIAYALAGEYVEGKPRFSFTPTIDSAQFAEEFFNDFDPMATSEVVEIRNVSEFFGYVGWVPLPGGEQAWPNSS